MKFDLRVIVNRSFEDSSKEMAIAKAEEIIQKLRENFCVTDHQLHIVEENPEPEILDPDADIFGEFPKGHPLAISVNDIKSWPQYDMDDA